MISMISLCANVLGKVVAQVDVIEFQKQGFPHYHLLIHFHVMIN